MIGKGGGGLNGEGKGWLICLDSDGCVMDTMRIKHERCFGPCLVKEWELWRWEQTVLQRWNEINLRQATRGVNRFKGLALILKEIDEKWQNIGGMDEIIRFAECSKELSARALRAEISARGRCTALKKALAWSEAVDKAVAALPPEAMPPFQGAKAAIDYAAERATIAVVSSAVKTAAQEEWRRFGLLDRVEYFFGQEDGSKAECLTRLVQSGYDRARVMMCGDAPGDMAAARSAGVAFYPVLAGKEEESWAAFPAVLDAFLAGEEWGSEALRRSFLENLRGM